MKKLLCLGLLLSIVPFTLVHASTHAIFSQVLADHVRDGWVDYRSLKNDARLDMYIMQLAGTNPESIPSRDEKLAFWINAYNAYTLKIIADNYPVKSIRDLNKGLFGGSVRDQQVVTINGEKTTLNTIEHKIIRPRFSEPRIHFALVCAAKSCPPLRSEAYEADRLEDQLDDQSRTFLSDSAKNGFDIKNKKASISMIFRWYGKDFAGTNQGLLLYLSRFLPAGAASSIRDNPAAWSVSYREYDWSLNER